MIDRLHRSRLDRGLVLVEPAPTETYGELGGDRLTDSSQHLQLGDEVAALGLGAEAGRAMYRIRYMVGETRGSFFTKFLPAIGALAAISVVLAALILASPLALRWPYEYLIVIAWIGLGLVIYRLSPRGLSKEETLRSLLGDCYDSIAAPGNPSVSRPDHTGSPATRTHHA